VLATKITTYNVTLTLKIKVIFMIIVDFFVFRYFMYVYNYIEM